MEDHGIIWCSWKSNEHIEPALSGDTDLDALFYAGDRYKVIQVMETCGFMLFSATSHRSYPGVLDFISIDVISGKVFHIHAHFLLTLGEQNIKSYIFPWNQQILDNRTKEKKYTKVYTSDLETELILLLIRYAIKIRWREYIKYKLKDKFGNKDFWTEYKWLREKLSDDKGDEILVSHPLKDTLGEAIFEDVVNIVNSEPDLVKMLSLKRNVERQSIDKGWRRLPTVLIPLCMWKNEIRNNAVRLFEKIGISQSFITRRRTLHNQGVVVTFLGADGAGKSTITNSIIQSWQHKIDVPYVYFGSGDGQKNILRFLFRLAVRIKTLFQKEGNKEAINKTYKAGTLEEANIRPSLSTIVSTIIGCIEKKRAMHKVMKLKAQGFIVVCDRWPQNQAGGINDGPLMENYLEHQHVLYRFIARWEQSQFSKICSRLQPDIVFKLLTSLDVALKRKPENNAVRKIIERKIKTLQELEFEEASRVVVIDAERPLKNVLQNVRQEIWSFVSEKRKYSPFYYECVGLPGAGKTTISKGSGVISLEEKLEKESSNVLFFMQSIISDPVSYVCIFRLLVTRPE
ncbi:MAG: hypothetical protein ACPG05_02640, partial [Bdellovibrionales bacterium]